MRCCLKAKVTPYLEHKSGEASAQVKWRSQTPRPSQCKVLLAEHIPLEHDSSSALILPLNTWLIFEKDRGWCLVVAMETFSGGKDERLSTKLLDELKNFGCMVGRDTFPFEVTQT